MPHTTDYGRSPSTRVTPLTRAGCSPALYCLLAVSAFLGFAIVPGGGLLAALMILAACGWLLWILLWAAGLLIRRMVVAATSAVGRREADEPRPVADSGRWSAPSLRHSELARSEV